jgi:cytochrome c
VEGPNDRLAGRPRREFLFGTSRALLAKRTVGNYWPYATTLFDYITRAMPQNAPGSLTADETYAVIAWILHRNGIVDADAVMDARTLPAVVMPAHDRFVPDDRVGGHEVR